MGAHGTLEEALANVQAFADAEKAHNNAAAKKDRKEKSSKSKKASKKERRDDKKHKDKKDSKRSKHKKEKKQSKRRESSLSDIGSSDSEGSHSDGDAPARSLQEELARGRHAARCVRDLLLRYPDQRKDLRQLLWTVDQGNALDVSGIPDADMQQRLVQLLSNLPLKRTKQGVFIKEAGASSVLVQLGGVFDETPAQLANGRARSEALQPAAAAAAASAKDVGESGANSSNDAANTPVQPRGASAGAADSAQPARSRSHTGAVGTNAAAIVADQPPTAATAHQPAIGVNYVREGSVELDYDDDDLDVTALPVGGPEHRNADDSHASIRPDIGPDCGPAIGPNFGPAIGPSTGPSLADAPDEAQEAHKAAEGGDAASSPRGVPPHRMGPALPPPELLAAAQEAAAAMAAEEAATEAEELIGPMPPEIIAEAEAAGDDKRTAELLRILRVLAAPERYVTNDKEPPAPDAYEVLGLPPDADAAAVKKRFRLLSLWVHPDKMDHPKAAEAFNAASGAAKTLRDTELRRQLDAAREDAEMRKAAIAQAEDMERARQWRVARGTATAEDLQGPISAEPEGRGAWMTELPVSRRPTAPSQVSVTQFSQQGIRKAGGAHEWTETPNQKLARLTAAAAAGPAALPGPAADAAQRRAAATAAVLDTFNVGSRRKTLVEEHAEKLAAEKKAKKQKKRKAAEAASGKSGKAGTDGEDWEENHPWRPFDREKDLGFSAAPVSQQDLLKKAGSLSSRFGGGSGGSRSFL